MPKINSLEVVHQDTNKDSYENLHDILVGLRNSLAVNREIVDGDARVAIENLLEMYVNDKEAFLRSLQTLTAQFKTSEAKYEEEILLQASALEALARKTTTLTAQTENNIASVREYSEAVASETARKVSTYNQPEPPTENLTYGDLWFDTDNNNRLYWWNGLVWSESSDTYNLNDFINTTYASDYAAIEAQVDSKAETWFQTADPSTAWTTQSIRDMHDKDMWYQASTKVLRIYVASTNTWTVIEDQTAINAAAAASTAQETADGKIVTFAQSTPPTPEGEGDIWMDTSNNNRTHRATATQINKTISYVNTSTEILTVSGHDFETADPVKYTTTGSSIGGLVNNSTYYVIYVSSSTLKLASSASNASSGTAINLTSSGSGTQILTKTELSWEDYDNGGATAYARWGVQVDVNGRVAGIQLNSNSTGTSEFTVLADAFKVYNTSSGTNTAVFTVKDGVVTPLNLRVNDSSGNWILKASPDAVGAQLWKPIISMGTAGNLGNPALAAFDANGTNTHVIQGEAKGSQSTNHGVRGRASAAGATSGIVGVANGYDFYADGAGTNYGPFTGTHDALVDPEETIEVGDIVIDAECVAKNGISSALCRITKSTTPNQKGSSGILCKMHGKLADTYPPAVFGFIEAQDDGFGNLYNNMTDTYNELKDKYNYAAMNALGEGQINVCGENGDIEAGDLIVSSSIPGKGMKQSDDIIRSYTVAKAREAITFNSPTEIKQVACIYLCG